MIRKYDRRLLTILSIVFVQIAGAALILPILPLFAERKFDLSPASVSLLVSSFFIAQFFAGPLLGQLSDRYGRIPLLIISQLGSAASFFLMAAAGSAWLLFAARVVDGITGGNIIIAQAYVTDITPREQRTEAFGYIFAAFGIGFIIGPALGGLFSSWFGPRFPFVIAGIASLVTAGMCLMLEETVQKDKVVLPRSANPVRGVRPSASGTGQLIRLSPTEVMRNTPLMLILAVGFIGQFGLGMLQATFALYAAAILFPKASINNTNLGVGLLLALVGVGQFVTQTWLIRPLKERFGDARLVILGNLFRAVALMIYAVFTSPWLAGVGSLLFAVGMGLTMPPLQTLATRTVDESLRGGVLGVFQSAVSLAIIISTAIAGVIFTAGATLPNWTGAALSVVAILPAWVVMVRANQTALVPCPTPCPEE
ncbi:MAG: tetracycline resistance protein [Chloroflexi bacterium]|nr:tetracycline resistance protein [Chloroflexota bacterium]